MSRGAGRTLTAAFWPIGVAAAYDSVGYAVVGPVLPALKVKAGASALAASGIFAGFAIGMTAGFVLAGTATRRRGARFTVVCGILLHVAADLVFMAGHGATAFTAARVIQGLGSGGLWMGSVFSVLTWWPERPGPGLARVLLAYSIGSVGGPALAVLGGTVRPFAADAVLGLIVLGLARQLPTGRRHGFGWHLRALKDRRLAFGSAVVLFAAFFWATLEGSYTLRFSARLSQTGLGVLIAFVTLVAGAGALLPAATRPRHGMAVAQGGMVLSAALVLIVNGTSAPVAWFLLLAVAGAASAAAETGALSLMAGMPTGGMLTTMVASSQAWALGFLIGPPGATWLATTFGRYAPGLALMSAALAAAAFGLTVPRQPSHRDPAT